MLIDKTRYGESRCRKRARPAAAGLLSLAMGAGVVAATSSPAHAQEPFECGAEGILTQGPEPGVPSTMQFIDMASGAVTAGEQLPVEVNGIGYNVLDDLIYGHARGIGLVRFGQDGELEELDVPADDEIGTAAVLVGDVDENGHLWLQRPAALEWFQVDVDPASATFGELLDSGEANGVVEDHLMGADWAFVPGTNALYQLAWVSGGNLELLAFDRDDLSYSIVSTTDLPGAQFGAVYADPDGFLYGSRNSDGEIIRFDVADGTATHFADGPPADFNDGARCFNAPIPVDFGDAPDSYGTLLASDGARHSVPGFDAAEQTAPLVLGTNVSIEPDGQPSPEADLDTFDDGVAEPITVASGDTPTITVTATNDTEDDATLTAWLDVGGTGAFDDGDRADVITVPAESGTQTYELTFPEVTTTEDTYIRFRLYGTEQDDPQPTGEAQGGEVEDYLVFVNNPELELDKSADGQDLEVGETVTYTVTATNTGDVILDDVVIEDIDFTGAGQLSAFDCDPSMPGPLAPGEAMICTTTYTVQEADAGQDLVNLATVSATPPVGPDLSTEAGETVETLELVVPDDPKLPVTGMAVSVLAPAGLLLVVVGASLVLAVARSRRSRAELMQG